MKIKILNTLLLSMAVTVSLAQANEQFTEVQQALKNRDFDRMIEILDTETLKGSDAAEAKYLLGLAYFNKKEPKQAVSYFDEAIDANDSVAKYYSMLAAAKIQVAQGMMPMLAGPTYFSALETYKKSVEIDPDHIPGHKGLVAYYSNAPGIAGGSMKKAFEHAEEIKRIDAVQGLAELAMLETKEKNFSVAHERYDEAIEIKPDAAWLYFRKGILFQMTDDPFSAGRYFKLALEKNPNFKRAADALKSLDQASRSDDVAPDFTFFSLSDGEKRSLSNYNGKLVLLNIWATWCGPCLEEMPDLNELQKTFEDQGLVVINLSDESEDKIQTYLKRYHMETTHVRIKDADDVPDYYQFGSARPKTFLIDREGKIVKTIIGAKNYEYFEDLIKEHS